MILLELIHKSNLLPLLCFQRCIARFFEMRISSSDAFVIYAFYSHYKRDYMQHYTIQDYLRYYSFYFHPYDLPVSLLHYQEMRSLQVYAHVVAYLVE